MTSKKALSRLVRYFINYLSSIRLFCSLDRALGCACVCARACAHVSVCDINLITFRLKNTSVIFSDLATL